MVSLRQSIYQNIYSKVLKNFGINVLNEAMRRGNGRQAAGLRNLLEAIFPVISAGDIAILYVDLPQEALMSEGEKLDKEREKHLRLLSWDNMSEDERALYVGAMIATRSDLWSSFPAPMRIGLAKKIARLEIREMESAGFGKIAEKLKALSTKNGLVRLFREHVTEKSKAWPYHIGRSPITPARRK